MDFQQAAEWVKDHETVIKGYIAKYRMFSPYEERDFMQEAFEAAMIAAIRSKQKHICFEAAFWKVFRNQISVLTPSPDILTHGSNSIPSHLCTKDLASISGRSTRRRTKQPDIEAIYKSICHLLTEREQQVLYLSLGIGKEGRLSNYEIADHLGCVVSNVRDILNRALERVRNLVNSGAIDPKRLA
ncbi:MAG: sigma-70 family RNA polymerase sigma factor [Desulfuromonadaceae bacterium]|nr:sigma-70 family RNA polymerase sigma factor [Desulfuromonadaceae bacterium]